MKDENVILSLIIAGEAGILLWTLMQIQPAVPVIDGVKQLLTELGYIKA